MLSPRAHTRRVIDGANMRDCKSTKTPLPLAHPLYLELVPATDEERITMDRIPFQEILDSLIYLSIRTRPDISTGVSMPRKFQADLTPEDWRAMKHLLCYLKGSLDYGVCMMASSD